MKETWVLSLGQEDPLEISWTEDHHILKWKFKKFSILQTRTLRLRDSKWLVYGHYRGGAGELSFGQLFETPWTLFCQAPLSMGFSRQEYWSGLPFSTPGDLPNPGIEPASPARQADSLPTVLPGFALNFTIFLETNIKGHIKRSSKLYACSTV